MRQQPPKRFNPLIPAGLIVLWLLVTFSWLFFALSAQAP